MTVEMKPLPSELIDALLADYKKPEDLIGQNGLLKQLIKALVERALQAELTDHLGHGKNQLVANESGNARNGRSKKTLKGDFGELPIEIPRDRAGTFEPQLIGKHQTRWSGLPFSLTSACRAFNLTAVYTKFGPPSRTRLAPVVRPDLLSRAGRRCGSLLALSCKPDRSLCQYVTLHLDLTQLASQLHEFLSFVCVQWPR